MIDAMDSLATDQLYGGFSVKQLKDVDLRALQAVVDQHIMPPSTAHPEMPATRDLNGSMTGDGDDAAIVGKPQIATVNGYDQEYPSNEPRYFHGETNGGGSYYRATPQTTPMVSSEEGVMPIAIVGMSCRFPGGATDLNKFWEIVSSGRSAWSEVPQERFNADAFYHPNPDRTDSVCVLVLAILF